MGSLGGRGGHTNNQQDNSGSLASGVSGSSTNTSSGSISAGGGQNSRVLNSDQANNGSQSVSMNGNTACALAGTGGALN